MRNSRTIAIRYSILSLELVLGLVVLSCSSDDDVVMTTTMPMTTTVTAPTDTKTMPCENGMAGEYPCNGYDLQYHLSIEELGFSDAEGNDSWGWVDATTAKEYAIVGTELGTAFVDISNPTAPIVLGTLATNTVKSPWRDIKVYQNHAYIVSDKPSNTTSNAHGMQVFDLTKLRAVTNPPEQFTADFVYTGITSAHNIVINKDSGYAYVTGTPRDDTYLGGATFIALQAPATPVAAGGYSVDGYSHDAQVVTYTGPDTDYTGKEIYIGSNENEVVIVDVTDKSNPIHISKLSYVNLGYTHQGWFTEDQKYFLLGDEIDELSFGNKTRTLVFDFTDLDSPILHTEYLGPTTAVDHNGYVHGTTFYQASYSAGVRMIDISDIENKNLSEIGFFDTYPENNNANFNGAWNVYPYLPSGNIIISDIDRGLFIVKKSAHNLSVKKTTASPEL